LLYVTLLLGAHVALPPFTFADPPEPPWLTGISDDADADDVGPVEMAMTALVETRPVPERTPEPAPPLPVPVQPTLPPILSPRALPIRAPPTA
jgi:hypothetical protein